MPRVIQRDHQDANFHNHTGLSLRCAVSDVICSEAPHTKSFMRLCWCSRWRLIFALEVQSLEFNKRSSGEAELFMLRDERSHPGLESLWYLARVRLLKKHSWLHFRLTESIVSNLPLYYLSSSCSDGMPVARTLGTLPAKSHHSYEFKNRRFSFFTEGSEEMV